jgi:hypothetical protein
MEAIEKKVSHTPGPWEVYRVFSSPLRDPGAGTEHLTHDIHGPKNVYLASVHYCNDANKTRVGHLRPMDRWEMEANAKLIAAAPDMLDALHKAYECINNLGDILNAMDAVSPEDVEKTTPLIRAVTAAIKKATE